MKSQEDLISDDEWLLRRVHVEWFEPTSTPSIQPYAFKPTLKGNFIDTTGISFYRQSCNENVSNILVKADPAKRHKYGIVRIPILYVRSLGLDVIRDDDTEHPIVLGHVVMPGINSDIYLNDKDGILPKMKALSDYVNSKGEFLVLPDMHRSS